MFQTAFYTLGIFCIIASLWTFNYEFRSNFYVHLTNLINYLNIAIMFVELFETIKNKIIYPLKVIKKGKENNEYFKRT